MIKLGSLDNISFSKGGNKGYMKVGHYYMNSKCICMKV
jgi:hypothetical protein